jgi:hypothetical protein
LVFVAFNWNWDTIERRRRLAARFLWIRLFDSSDPADWANESFAIAERPETKYCIHQGASCELPSPAKVKIDAAYVEANTPIVREQLQKAGVRLAYLLDASLGK